MRKYVKILWAIIIFPFRIIGYFFRWILKSFASIRNRVNSFFYDEEEEAPLPDAFAKAVRNPQGVMEHLFILRKHLVRAVIAIVLCTALSFTFITQIMEFLARPLSGGLSTLTAIEVTENVGAVMRITLLSGFAIAFPYVVLEIWLFIAPGVHPKTRIYGLAAIPTAIALFLLGLAFTYFVMLPVALPFLFNFMGLNTVPRPSSYFNFVTGVMFWIGISFEFPLVAYILAGLGIINAKILISQWRLAIVLIAILAAAITPTVDPVNMSLVMGPMIILYLLSILLAKLAQRNRQQADTE